MRSARLAGNSSSAFGRGAGIWCRNEVSRWELWMMMGNSTKMSLYVSFVFCILSSHQWKHFQACGTATYFSVVNLLSLYAAIKLGDNRNARKLSAP